MAASLPRTAPRSFLEELREFYTKPISTALADPLPFAIVLLLGCVVGYEWASLGFEYRCEGTSDFYNLVCDVGVTAILAFICTSLFAFIYIYFRRSRSEWLTLAVLPVVIFCCAIALAIVRRGQGYIGPLVRNKLAAFCDDTPLTTSFHLAHMHFTVCYDALCRRLLNK